MAGNALARCVSLLAGNNYVLREGDIEKSIIVPGHIINHVPLPKYPGCLRINLFSFQPWEPQSVYDDFSSKVTCGDSWGKFQSRAPSVLLVAVNVTINFVTRTERQISQGGEGWISFGL